MTPYKKALRWIGILPAMIGGLIVGAFLVNLFSVIQIWLMGADSESGIANILRWAVSSFAGGSLSIYWAVKMAPSSHKIVGAVTTGIILICSVFLFIISVTYGSGGWFWPLIGSISLASGAGYVMHQIYEEGENFKLY